MASGIEILGLVQSVSAIISLISKMVDIIQIMQSQGHDERDLRLKFSADSKALEDIQNRLSKYKSTTAQAMSKDEDEKLLDIITGHLCLLQSRLEKHMAKIDTALNPEQESSTATTSVPAASSRFLWVIWRRRDLEKMERSLWDWIQRVNLICSTAWFGRFDETNTGNLSRTPHSIDRMNLKIQDYRRFSERPVDDDRLLKPIESIIILGSSSRRNLASLEQQPLQNQSVVVEYTAQSYRQGDSAAIRQIENATRDLAKLLYSSDPDRTGLLRCMGYTHNTRLSSFGLLYELPPPIGNMAASTEQYTEASNSDGSKFILKSLRDLYIEDYHPTFSLTDRVKLCCDVAKAVLYVHQLGWVHKSVRPDNIVFFSSMAAADHNKGQLPPTVAIGNIAPKKRTSSSAKTQKMLLAIPQCYLVGFEYARRAEAVSNRLGDSNTEHNLYRHPRRQGIMSNSEYTMAHDIYSLGVVCLEIGMWGHNFGPKLPYGSSSRFKGLRAEGVQRELIRVLDGRLDESTSGGLATVMGDRFTEVVRYCLSIGSAEDVGSTQYIQEVWLKLDDIRSAL